MLKFKLDAVWLLFFSCSLLLVSCSKHPLATNPVPLAKNGFSGMAKIDGNSYLAVHDKLSFEKGNRISVVRTSRDKNVDIRPVEISDWNHENGQSSDLEAVCKIPDRNGEFLLVEAGHWEGKFGRMFHIRIDLTKQLYHARVLGVFELPEFDSKSSNDREGDEIEGVVCATKTKDKVLVILGERGGSSVYPSGLLRWVVADLSSHRLAWSKSGKRGRMVNAPGSWKNPYKNRDIAALYLDLNKSLWATATEDLGDSGVFNTVIYKIGTVDVRSANPIKIIRPFKVSHSISGFKGEALAGPTTEVSGSVFTIGTEDEVYGGVWRPIK